MSLRITKILPNPSGKDPSGEWLEIQNTGTETEKLAGWAIKDSAGKKFIFSGKNINALESTRLGFEQTKIQLNNNEEKIFLINPQGKTVDEFEYKNAKENQIFEKKAEVKPINPEIILPSAEFSTEKIIKQSLSTGSVIIAGLVIGLVGAMAAFTAIKKIKRF